MPIIAKPVRKCAHCDNEFYSENAVEGKYCSMYCADKDSYEKGEMDIWWGD